MINKSKEELVRLLEEPDATACYVWVIMHGRSLLGYINELEQVAERNLK